MGDIDIEMRNWWELSPLLLAMGSFGRGWSVNPAWSLTLGDPLAARGLSGPEPELLVGMERARKEGVAEVDTFAHVAGGGRRWIRWTVVHGGGEFHLVGADVTDARLPTGALAQDAQAIARVAGSVAHDLNNLLAVLLGHASFVREALSGTEHSADLDLVLMAGHKCAAAVRHLLRQSRGPRVSGEEVAMGPLVRELVGLYGRSIGVPVSFQERGGPVVLVDRAALEAVVLNLLLNARDAGAREIVLSVGESEQRRWLSVVDDGVGMTRETLARCRKPLFSTKGEAGSGLGLFGATLFADRWGATLEIASAPGDGCSVTLAWSIADGISD